MCAGREGMQDTRDSAQHFDYHTEQTLANSEEPVNNTTPEIANELCLLNKQ